MGETGHVYKSIGRNRLRERLKGKTEGLRELETFMEGDGSGAEVYTVCPAKEAVRLSPETTGMVVGSLMGVEKIWKHLWENCADQDRLWISVIINLLVQQLSLCPFKFIGGSFCVI